MTHNCNYLEIVKISENYDQGQILAANLFSIVQQWTVGTSLFSDLVVAIVLSKTISFELHIVLLTMTFISPHYFRETCNWSWEGSLRVWTLKCKQLRLISCHKKNMHYEVGIAGASPGFMPPGNLISPSVILKPSILKGESTSSPLGFSHSTNKNIPGLHRNSWLASSAFLFSCYWLQFSTASLPLVFFPLQMLILYSALP